MSLVDLEEQAHRLRLDFMRQLEFAGGSASLDQLLDVLEIVHALITREMGEPQSSRPETATAPEPIEGQPGGQP